MYWPWTVSGVLRAAQKAVLNVRVLQVLLAAKALMTIGYCLCQKSPVSRVYSRHSLHYIVSRKIYIVRRNVYAPIYYSATLV